MTADELREAREELGLTQEDMAQLLGVLVKGRPHRARLSDWERGARDVPDPIAAHVRTLLRQTGTRG